ncbi:hypothetical protein ACFSHQ_11150 [Gemmobacter lanyuensis]
MPYRFELSDVSLTQGMRRLALAEIARIQDALSQDPADTAAIHTARKGIKKLRALLRLLRAGLADVQPAENAILRAAGHALAGQGMQRCGWPPLTGWWRAPICPALPRCGRTF